MAEDHAAGVLVKLAGSVTPNPATGQLESTFENTPQLPFEDLTLRFFGGERASTSTPPLCGAYTTSAAFTPWSGGTASDASDPASRSAPGPAEGRARRDRSHSPPASRRGRELTAGVFTPFALTLQRPDGQQALTV